MKSFTDEEINLFCLYDPGNRAGAVYELRSMMQALMPDETELRNLAERLISKMESMNDREYEQLCELLTQDSFDVYSEATIDMIADEEQMLTENEIDDENDKE